MISSTSNNYQLSPIVGSRKFCLRINVMYHCIRWYRQSARLNLRSKLYWLKPQTMLGWHAIIFCQHKMIMGCSQGKLQGGIGSLLDPCVNAQFQHHLFFLFIIIYFIFWLHQHFWHWPFWETLSIMKIFIFQTCNILKLSKHCAPCLQCTTLIEEVHQPL